MTIETVLMDARIVRGRDVLAEMNRLLLIGSGREIRFLRTAVILHVHGREATRQRYEIQISNDRIGRWCFTVVRRRPTTASHATANDAEVRILDNRRNRRVRIRSCRSKSHLKVSTESVFVAFRIRRRVIILIEAHANLF